MSKHTFKKVKLKQNKTNLKFIKTYNACDEFFMFYFVDIAEFTILCQYFDPVTNYVSNSQYHIQTRPYKSKRILKYLICNHDNKFSDKYTIQNFIKTNLAIEVCN